MTEYTPENTPDSPAPVQANADVAVESDFDFNISQRPDFALLEVQLQPGQQINAERSAMATMSPNIDLKSGFKGGLKASVGRALGGESIIINTFTAQNGPAEVTFASGQLGDMVHYHLRGNSLMLQRGAYVAGSTTVEVTGKWQGAKGFFSGEGLVLLRAHGQGDVFFNSYGAILEYDLAGEDMFVDTGYIVAFEDTLEYRVTTLPGLKTGGKVKSFFFGGEGLVTRFTGQGKLWVQTRAVNPFLTWVYPYRPASNN